MINKKNELGKNPFELGTKDAIHVAIVSVRAGAHIIPGTKCGFNEFNEAISNSKGVGVADPFISSIERGDKFWLLLAQDQVPNVQHVWEHPTVEFALPTRKVKLNQYLERSANELGVTYLQLMVACAQVVETNSPVAYPGAKSQEEVDEVEIYDIWREWANETGHEFENIGSSCCPEYQYPEVLFRFEDEYWIKPS